MAKTKKAATPAKTTSLPSISEAVSYGWGQTKKQFLPIWGFLLIAGIINSVMNNMGDGLIIRLLSMFVSVAVSLAMSKAVARLGRGEKVDFADYWNHLSRFVDFAVTNIVLMIMVCLGLIFFIVPGIYLAIRFGYAPILVVDKGMSFSDALTGSTNMTRGNMWGLFGIGLAMIGLIVVGALALGVGLLLAVPVAMVAQGYVYNRLVSRA